MEKNALPNLNSDQGSISLGIMMGMVGAIIIVVMQITTSFGFLGLQHRKQKNILKSRASIVLMAQNLKQAYNLGQMDPTCASFIAGGVAFFARQINGMNFCFQDQIKICATVREMGVPDHQVCISNRNDSLAWNNDPNMLDQPILNTSGELAPGDAQHTTVNRIRIPDPSEAQHPWRTCNSPLGGCVRLVLCEREVPDCTVAESLATQVVRLGRVD